MTESASRYAIMEGLNDKKLLAKRELDTLEQELETTTLEEGKKVQTVKINIKNKKSSYKQEFQDWKANKEIELKMKRREMEGTIEELNQQIKDREDNYESDHKTWVNSMEAQLTQIVKHNEDFERKQEMKIKSKKEEVELINSSINDLKDLGSTSESKKE